MNLYSLPALRAIVNPSCLGLLSLSLEHTMVSPTSSSPSLKLTIPTSTPVTELTFC